MTSPSRMPKGIDKEALKRQAAGHWPEILSAVGGAPAEILDGKHHPCPKCGGTDRFRMIDKDAGAIFCNQCPGGKDIGDGIASLMFLRDWDFSTALVELAKHQGTAPATAPHANGKPTDRGDVQLCR